ncbi:MAG: hypothetical protein M5U08_17420 [Burkholderiales bacterium]|nr:hypothetical protein [Burkholderiales bacterium]
MVRKSDNEIPPRDPRGEMAGRGTIEDWLQADGDGFGDAPATSLEELLEIFAELSERVARLERATVLLLAEKNGDALAAAAEPGIASAAYADPAARPQSVPVAPPPGAPAAGQAAPAASPRAPQPAAARPASRVAPASGADLTQVDFDLPAHQWGGEGNRNPGLVTPIQDTVYPAIKYAQEEEQPKPKRTGPPERALVRAAIEGYPHIIESVCLFWGGRECDTYLSKLVIDTRGGRRGFPQDVMDELLFLAEVATIKSGVKPDFTPFDRERFL